MGTTVQLNLIDRSNERTAVRIPTYALAAGTIATLQAFEDDFATLIAPLSYLNDTGTSLNDVSRAAFITPTNDLAVRELAVRFVMEDANANQVSFSIGGPKLGEFPFEVGDGGDTFAWDAALANVALAEFVADVLTIARHPISGLALTMKRLELIGRNN